MSWLKDRRRRKMLSRRFLQITKLRNGKSTIQLRGSNFMYESMLIRIQMGGEWFTSVTIRTSDVDDELKKYIIENAAMPEEYSPEEPTEIFRLEN